MMRLRPLVAILLSLLLIGAQQAAFAHMIGHLGVSTEMVATEDDGHGEALSLSHVCTTCVSLSALDAGAPFGVPPRLTFDGAFAVPTSAAATDVVASARGAYLARAPPPAL